VRLRAHETCVPRGAARPHPLRHHLAPRGVNGQPGALFFDREGRLIAVMSIDVAEDQIQGVSSIVNPDKLRHLGPLADLGALLRERS
jgi:RNA polymerase sigma-70 factor (ECF subfamily)